MFIVTRITAVGVWERLLDINNSSGTDLLSIFRMSSTNGLRLLFKDANTTIIDYRTSVDVLDQVNTKVIAYTISNKALPVASIWCNGVNISSTYTTQ